MKVRHLVMQMVMETLKKTVIHLGLNLDLRIRWHLVRKMVNHLVKTMDYLREMN